MKTIKVSAGVIIDDDKVLITRRAPKENFAGGWEFPGGKIEFNETAQKCLVRELKEELNIAVSVGEFCTEVTHDYGNMNINLIAYYLFLISLSVIGGGRFRHRGWRQKIRYFPDSSLIPSVQWRLIRLYYWV